MWSWKFVCQSAIAATLCALRAFAYLLLLTAGLMKKATNLTEYNVCHSESLQQPSKLSY